jgi:hypothetical protein
MQTIVRAPLRCSCGRTRVRSGRVPSLARTRSATRGDSVPVPAVRTRALHRLAQSRHAHNLPAMPYARSSARRAREPRRANHAGWARAVAARSASAASARAGPCVVVIRDSVWNARRVCRRNPRSVYRRANRRKLTLERKVGYFASSFHTSTVASDPLASSASNRIADRGVTPTRVNRRRSLRQVRRCRREQGYRVPFLWLDRSVGSGACSR